MKLNSRKRMFYLIYLLLLVPGVWCLLPPKFQWKTLDFAWEGQARDSAIKSGAYIPENNMPAGIARWKDRLFITIPRWKKGVPASLNYIYLNSTHSPLLNPYPSWADAFLSSKACCASSNSTVVSTFRVHVDKCGRLWVVDNGVTNMAHDVKQIAPPAIFIFDLKTDKLMHRYTIKDELLRDSSVFTSIVVDITGKECKDAYAYIPDMGSNALIVYSLKDNDAWRVENHYFHFDPHAGVYRVGGIDFYWSDGISSVALGPIKKNCRDLYFHPTSSTKQFAMSTKLLKNKNVPREDIFMGVQVIGNRGPQTQATACDFDLEHNVLFHTLLSKNGVSCWNVDKPFKRDNVPLIISECTALEFPNDIKVDHEGSLWILSNRQSRFLYEAMNFTDVNFRVLSAPVASVIQGTACERTSAVSKAFSFMTRPRCNSECKVNSGTT
ncbi:L-dopachrome tautomerase yellow-f-like [Epargyreus clarus]|uniref:L-dopachrome tautomerase yellow-f-like n=1 Tax=Epargyreus clarus TaxID=520877 RepID=UPI003C2D13EB